MAGVGKSSCSGSSSSSSSITLLALAGRALNVAVSFVVFSFLDVLDVVLCIVYKLIDYFVEAEWKPCYCSSSKNTIASSGAMVVAKTTGPKVLRLCSTRLQLEDISDTLYARPSVVKEVTRTAISPATTTFTISSGIAEMIKGKIGRRRPLPDPCWSDCDCKTCNSWSSSPSGSHLYVHVEEPKGGETAEEDVVFIHGFISSSLFWTETVFPVFSEETKSTYRLFAVDLLGFGRSPKPADSLYTLREHVEMIDKSVLQRYKVKSFHIVAHSLGSVLALALAVKYPDAIKSLTLLAPPYFPVPKGMEGAAAQYVMRRVAPRRVWPAIAFGGSMACWYEHVSRTICLTICKHHRLWDSLFKFLTRNRMKTYLIESFMCHTHNAAWHTLHNIICGSATKMENYLDIVRDRLSCNITIFHGQKDELLPVDCSYAVGSKIPRARVKVFDKKDHITIIVGQERVFAKELEEIWKNKRA
ncbi:probable lysophospholipase BODYGUARD 3 [Typha latifolia]|uniref:probable lysophospholipase BODYGUARD 3 n=1 Tax=Typha latifolia TaxID=4733 RepID=UPI003C2BDC61